MSSKRIQYRTGEIINMDKQFIKAEAIVRLCFSDISVSLIQRHLLVGYSAGIELMSQLISRGVVIDHGESISIRRYRLTENTPIFNQR